jgi:hypothetical protein
MPYDHVFRPSTEILVEHNVTDEHGLLDQANRDLVNLVGNKLAQDYPGHPWGVIAEIEHGIVKVCIQGFSQWPYIIHVSTLKSDPSLRSVREAGGHLLERLKMPRKGFSMADWKSATAALPWHFNRNRQAPV